MSANRKATHTQDKVTALKQKQGRWLKERAQSINGPGKIPKNQSESHLSTKQKRNPPLRSVDGKVQTKKSDVLLWNAGNKETANYSGFVVRKSSGSDTNRSQRSVKSNSSSKHKDLDVLKPVTAKSVSQFVPSKTKPLKATESRSPTTETESLNLKMNDYFSKLMDTKYDHTKYDRETEQKSDFMHDRPSRFLNENSATSMSVSSLKPMNNHICRVCGVHMKEKSNSPQTVYPCGHCFCLACLVGQKFCPECNCNIVTIELNTTLWKVIHKFQDQLELEDKIRKEKEARKYIDEYQSLKTRSTVMQDEAGEIIDKMENITHELVTHRNRSKEIENTASSIKENIKQLTVKLESLQTEHGTELDCIQSLDVEYDNHKQQLLLIEKTLKTLGKSRERVKMMIESVLPDFHIDEELSD